MVSCITGYLLSQSGEYDSEILERHQWLGIGVAVLSFVFYFLKKRDYRWEAGVGMRDWLGSALKPGKHTIVFDFKYDGPGFGKGGTGVLSVDGKEIDRKTVKHTVPLMMTIDENMDIGLDTGTAVDGSYELPFKFTGTIDKLTYKLGPSQMSAAEQKAGADTIKKVTD